jgi:hypothetical protein
MWSSVKGPPKRGVGEEIVPDRATRETQFFTLRDLIPTEHSVNFLSLADACTRAAGTEGLNLADDGVSTHHNECAAG